MLVLVADITEFDEHYRINWIVERDDQVVVDSGRYYKKISSAAAELVNDELMKGSFVVARKPVNEEIRLEHIVVKEIDEFEKKRCAELARARQNMSGIACLLRGFDFFEFTLCNNYLASRGYFITNHNREEKYIEIINSCDMELIEHLENYLNLLDKIGIPNYQYNRYLKFEEALKNVRNEEELEKEVRKFYDN